MKTVNEIMDIVSDYGQGVKDYGHTEASGNTFSLIRTAIEELAADARRYQWFANIAVTGEFANIAVTGEFAKAEAAFARFDDVDECIKAELDAAIDADMEST